MRRTAVVGLVILASLAGCPHLTPRSPGAATAEQSAVNPSAPRASSDSTSQPTQSSPDAKASPSIVEPTPTITPNRSEPTPASRSAVELPVLETSPGPVGLGRTGTTTAAAVARPAGTPASTPASASTALAKPPAPPSLDLAALEQRLRDTRAVGLFTKLSLKNQVDELLGQFRAYYRGDKTVPPSQLRQRYDGLLLKVLSVLQDGDPPLASQIWSSREAIWEVLADPAKFEKI